MSGSRQRRESQVGQFRFSYPNPENRVYVPGGPTNPFAPRSAQANAFQSSARAALNLYQYILVLPGMPIFLAVPPSTGDSRVGLFIGNNFKIYDGQYNPLIEAVRGSSKLVANNGTDLTSGWAKVPYDASSLIRSASNVKVNIPEPLILRLPARGTIAIMQPMNPGGDVA